MNGYEAANLIDACTSDLRKVKIHECGPERIGSINGEPIYRPCSVCQPPAPDGMDADMVRHSQKHGTGVRPAWD